MKGLKHHHSETYLLASEEEEAVTFIFLTHMNLDDSADGCLEVVSLRLGGVEDLHRVCTPRDGQQGTVVEVHLELPSIQGGAHDDHLCMKELLSFCLQLICLKININGVLRI